MNINGNLNILYNLFTKYRILLYTCIFCVYIEIS